MVGVSTLLVVLMAVLAGTKFCDSLRRDCARRWMHEIASVMDALDALGEPGAALPLGVALDGRDRALLGAEAAGSAAHFLDEAARLSDGEGERQRVLGLGDAALRRLRDVATGRRHDVVTRA